jgi:hypothetical protein
MSTPHSRLFEASLAALLLADRGEEELPAAVPAPGEWYKSVGSHKIRADVEGSASAEEAG